MLSVDEKRRLIKAAKMPPPPPLPATAKQFSVPPGSVKGSVRIMAPIDLEDDQQYDLVTEPTGGYDSYPLLSIAKSQGTRMKLSIYVSPGAAHVPMRAVALLHKGKPIGGFSPEDVELPAVASNSAAAAKRSRTS